MEMVWQDAHSICFEWQARLDCAIDLPQAFDMFDEKLAGSVSQHDCEEKYSAFDFWAPISRHRRIMA
jgi:hypothetical protein